MEITSAPDRTLYTEESLTLTCEITLSPSVNTAVDISVTWMGTQGEMLSTGGRVTVSDVTGSSPYLSSLILIALEEADTGMYMCTASAGPVNSAFVTASDASSSTLQVTVGKHSVCTCISAWWIVSLVKISRLRIITFQSNTMSPSLPLLTLRLARHTL